jgi:hypothetical protein
MASITAMLRKRKGAKVDRRNVSGLILFNEDGKICIFASKRKIRSEAVYAIIDRGNGEMVGLSFLSTGCVKFFNLQKNIFYRLHPIIFY